MITDFFILHKRKITPEYLDDLYDDNGNHAGVNWAAILAIAIGAGCSFLTPIASGTNQTLMIFTNLKFTDFAKFGWPLVIISFICCVGILPLVFPFF